MQNQSNSLISFDTKLKTSLAGHEKKHSTIPPNLVPVFERDFLLTHLNAMQSYSSYKEVFKSILGFYPRGVSAMLVPLRSK